MSHGARFEDLGIGVGLRTVHYGHIVENGPAVDWFEILSENYMNTAGRPLHFLDQIAERYPIVMHGVSLSIGSTDELDWDYLRGLKELRQRVGARWVSDHLCWTGVMGKNSHDLLPMPFTEEALRHTAARIRAVQDFLGAPLVLENPSSYAEFAESTTDEATFIAELLREADARLLLDVNNVYVSAFNHGFDASEYLKRLPLDRVVQFHVAGHTQHDTHIIDSHSGPVIDAVWQLLADAWRLGARAPLLLEWDADIPEFEQVHAEALRAKEILKRVNDAGRAA